MYAKASVWKARGGSGYIVAHQKRKMRLLNRRKIFQRIIKRGLLQAVNRLKRTKVLMVIVVVDDYRLLRVNLVLHISQLHGKVI